MARRNQNSFIKRQKKLKRVRKAKEKMARRQGKKVADEHTFDGPPPEKESPTPGDDSPVAETEGVTEAEA